MSPLPRRRFLLFAAGLLLCGCSEQRQESAAPRLGRARLGLDGQGGMQISAEDRCGLCGMMVSRYKKFAAGIALDDGATYYFCGTQCMLRAWLLPKPFLGADHARIARVVVTDYFSGRHLDGSRAVFVRGSDVLDPMGASFIALAGEEDARAFIGRHGGEIVQGLAAISEGVWRSVTGRTLQD